MKLLFALPPLFLLGLIGVTFLLPDGEPSRRLFRTFETFFLVSFGAMVGAGSGRTMPGTPEKPS